MTTNRDIYVYIDWAGLETPILMGVLNSKVVRGKEVFSFDSDRAWLKHNQCRMLDPDLGQFAGAQYLRDEKVNFGLFLDSAPDRWGRMLMKKREAILARAQGRKPEPLFEADYLLGVYDGNRMGALRFKTNPDGAYMDDNKDLATPPWASIRDLEYASLQLEREDMDASEYAKWIGMLIAPGSSLGGARPKANVVDKNGHLWIAKFPSRNDTKDMGAWEMVTSELAKNCGIEVAESKAQRFLGTQHTFLSKRFDRSHTGARIHFASAMTMLGMTDGADHTTGAGYLSLAAFIMAHGADVGKNLKELWRRIVFNIAVSNCDDHLRNHGFLLTKRGWALSPAYDVNPDEYGSGLKLNISEDDNSLDFDLAMSVAPYFRLSKEEAYSILLHVTTSVSQWRKVALQYGISKYEQELMESAFHLGV